jgi:hypothetical protein
MRNFVVALMIAAGLLSGITGAHASSETTFTTGRDWTEKMTPLEKFMSVAVPMSTLQRYGVRFRHMPIEYLPTIDRVIRNNPNLFDEDVSNILASAVYALEPESQPAFNDLEARFLRGDFESQPVRLIIPSLKE